MKNRKNQTLFISTPLLKESKIFELWEKAEPIPEGYRNLKICDEAENNADQLKSFFNSCLGQPWHVNYSSMFENMSEEVEV